VTRKLFRRLEPRRCPPIIYSFSARMTKTFSTENIPNEKPEARTIRMCNKLIVLLRSLMDNRIRTRAARKFSVTKNPFTCIVSTNGGFNTISARRWLCKSLSAHTADIRHLKHPEHHISQRFVVSTITFLVKNTFSHWRRYQLAISRKWYNRTVT